MKQKLLNSFRLKATLLVAVLCALFTGTAWADDVTDELTASDLAATSTAYTNFSNVSKTSDAVYAGNSAKDGSGNIQLRSKNSTSGIVSTTSGGKVKSITITVGSGSNTVDVYGSNSAYSGASDLYGDNKGTKLGSVSSTGTINVSGDYEYVGIRSNNGALYLSKIEIVWTTSGGGGSSLTDSDLALTGVPIAFNFDLYNNSTAQVINYTTSSTGAVTIADNEYAEFDIDEENKTITVTPTTVTPSAQTITINQEADATYDAGSATFTVTITDSTPIPTHTATFSVNGATSSQDVEEGASISFPNNPADINGKTFVGWVTSAIVGTTDEAPSFITSALMGNANVTYYAVFATVGAGNEQDASITIDADQNATGFPTGYAAAADYTLSGVSFNILQGYKNGAKLQWRASGNSNGTGTMYNNDALNKLQSIVLTYDDSDNNKNFTVKIGDSANPTSGTEISPTANNNNTVYTFDCSSYNKDYFVMTNGSGAGYLTSIVINYKSGSANTYSGYCTTVPEIVAVSSVSVAASASVNVGETTTLTATVLPNDATNKNVTWESDDETIVTVDANGVVTGVAAGTATITVTSVADNTKTATCTVTVTTVAVTGVSVDATASVNVGETTTLTATVSPSNATNKNVTWESGNTSIATVDENGVVTGVAAGSTTITVTSVADNTKTASCTVTVSLVPGTEARPYTVAEAITAIDDNGGDVIENVYVGGIISQVDSYNSTYHSITYWISADGTTSNQFEVYSGKGINGANFSGMSDLEVGDQVVVKGNIKKYNEIYEFASNSQLVSRVEKPASDLAKTSDIVLDYLNNNTTTDVTEYITSSSTGAYTFTVGDGTIIENADEVISALAVGSTTVTVNQAATLSYKAGSVVINVTVQDTRTAASTIPAINISTLTEGAADGTIEVVNPVKADEGATFSFASSDEDVLLIIDDAYSVGEVGTATVTVTATPSNTNLYKPVVANFNVIVQAASMEENEITLAAYSGSTVYGTPLNVNYTVADGYDGTMGYSIANSAIADVTIGASAITFTPKAVGSTTVTISAPATGNFYAADDVTYTLTVTAPEGKTTAFEAGTVVLDFTDNSDWGFPEGSSNVTTGEHQYTSSGYTITLDASSNGYYYNTSDKYLLMGKSGTTLTLPTFDKAVTKIDVTGRTGASGKVNQNIFVGSIAVSEQTTGATGTNEYEIAPDYQAAGNIYTLQVTSAHNTQITSITVHFKGITAKLNGSGYATFCSEYPLDFSEATGYTAWYIKSISGETITFSPVTGSVKGGTGLFLMGTANETITLTSANSTNTINDNLLVGTTAPTYVTAGEVYGLSGSQFVPSNANGTIKAGKAYIDADDVPELSSVKAFTFVFEDPTTGITETRTVAREEVEGIFNLAGQRMSKMQKGINIVNGKKVLVK